MTDTLFDVVKKIGEMAGGSRSGKATGGTTSTIVDTRRAEVNDTFNQGTALIYETTDGLAPQKEWATITDWALSGTVATVSPVFSATITANDKYMFILPKYPLDKIIDKINQVLTGERISIIDIDSLEVVADQNEYSLPAGCDRSNLRQVYVATSDDTNKREWMPCMEWNVEFDATDGGTGHVLTLRAADVDSVFDGMPIKLVYTPYHANVYDPSDEIDDLIHLDRLCWPTLELLLYDDMAMNQGDKWLNHRLNYVMEKAQVANAKHPIRLPEWQAKGSGW